MKYFISMQYNLFTASRIQGKAIGTELELQITLWLSRSKRS